MKRQFYEIFYKEKNQNKEFEKQPEEKIVLYKTTLIRQSAETLGARESGTTYSTC